MPAIVQVLLGIVGVVVSGLIFVGLPFEWGQKCAQWHRAHGVSRSDAYVRAITPVSILLLACYMLVPEAENRIIVFWLLVIGDVAAIVGVRWDLRFHREPPKLSWRLSGESPWDVYKCWKCGKTKSCPWNYEATVQDTLRHEYVFGWFEVCDDCAETARATPSGPWKT
jgi:hypothetical protein